MRLGGACALSSCAGDSTDPRLFQNLSYSGNLTVAVHQCITTSMRVRLASEIWFSWSRWAAACSRGMRTQPEAAVTASFESVACQYSRLVPKRPPAACFLNVDSETLQPFQRLNRGRPCGGRGTGRHAMKHGLRSIQCKYVALACPGSCLGAFRGWSFLTWFRSRRTSLAKGFWKRRRATNVARAMWQLRRTAWME